MGDAAWPSSAFVVLNRSLVHLTGTPGREWSSIECASKKAYGCGRNGQKVVEGLSLYVSRLENFDLTSSLSIHLSGEALRCIEADLEAPSGMLEVAGTVQIAHKQLLVLLVCVRRRCHGKLAYYVVYDNTDASLYMIPHIPHELEVTYTQAPVPERTADGSHELVLMAREYLPVRADRGRLCVFSPANPRAGNTGGPWQVKVLRFPQLSQVFSADVLFSFQGKAFWADPSHGLAYSSDLRTGGTVVDVAYINLPVAYEQPELAVLDRTIGCVGGSIRFVCIERTSPGDDIVKVWTLDLLHQRWNLESRCSWKVLWEQIPAPLVKGLGLKDVEPQFPVLMPDGALCLLLRDMNREFSVEEEKDYICSFDMHRKSLLWYGRVVDYSITGPVILPYRLFTKCFPPRPRERKILANNRDSCGRRPSALLPPFRL